MARRAEEGGGVSVIRAHVLTVAPVAALLAVAFLAAMPAAARAQSPAPATQGMSDQERQMWRDRKARAKQPHTAFGAAREAFRTQVTLPRVHPQPAPAPPADAFVKVMYPSAVGPLAAYVTPDPRDGKRRAAIVWITGGDSNSLDEMWLPKPRSNDQSAAAYRKAGVVTMFPSLRGGNDNPGKREGFFGEVDDVIAALSFLARQPHVDPERIYLGGHSTGGTLALLVAEAGGRFRAVFAFGPVAEASRYGPSIIPVDFRKLDPREAGMRAPVNWLDSIRTAVFVIEGTEGNIDALRELRATSRNPMISFVPVEGASHFSVLAPANEAIARAILQDSGGGASRIRLDEKQLAAAVRSGR